MACVGWPGEKGLNILELKPNLSNQNNRCDVSWPAHFIQCVQSVATVWMDDSKKEHWNHTTAPTKKFVSPKIVIGSNWIPGLCEW
jgi:hypothetical protein